LNFLRYSLSQFVINLYLFCRTFNTTISKPMFHFFLNNNNFIFEYFSILDNFIYDYSNKIMNYVIELNS